MVNPKKDPGFEPHETHPDYVGKEKQAKQKMRTLWRQRMHSGLCRMSLGAQNLFRSIPWPKGDNWRRNNKKK